MTTDTASQALNNQQVFDRVVRHLRKQGHPAVDAEGNCAYRLPNGDSCAIGCLIPEDEYNPRIEGYPVDKLEVRRMLPLSLNGLDLEFMEALQFAHDSWLSGRPFPNKDFKAIVKEFNLDPAVLSESEYVC